MAERIPRPLALLLAILQDLQHVQGLALSDWEPVIRLARAARVHATLGHRLMANPDCWAAVPEQPRGHLEAAMNFAAWRRHLLDMELRALDAQLPAEIEVVLIKGAAYQAQHLPLAEGRLSADIDLLVRRADLDAAEAALVEVGWRSTVTDPYDQRYYREWSHELPPMQAEGHALELDLHHGIAPVTSRCQPDPGVLWAGRQRLPDSRYFVLDPMDQLIHAVVHLFQDTELDGRLRDLLDIDAMLRALPNDGEVRAALAVRVAMFGAGDLFWYALDACQRWLGTPVPAALWPAPPARLPRATMAWMLPRTLLPRLPEARAGLGSSIAAKLAHLRYHRMRMPAGLLLRHSLAKGWRRLRLRRVR